MQQGAKKSRPTVGGGLARLGRLLCGKPPAFREAAGPKDFIVFLFWPARPERLSLSAQQAAEPRFFHTLQSSSHYWVPVTFLNNAVPLKFIITVRMLRWWNAL